MVYSDRLASAHRGRPAAGAKRNVSVDIYRAAEECLHRKNVTEITIREIAGGAGTTEAMVVYYYGSKNGLFTEIVEKSLHEILVELKDLGDRVLLNQQMSTKEYIENIIDIYYSRIPAARILSTELVKDNSEIKNFYIEHWAKETSQVIGKIIEELVRRGVYRADVDVPQVVMMLKSLIVYPLVSDSYVRMEGFRLESFRETQWVDALARMLDGFLASTPQPSGEAPPMPLTSRH